MAISIGKLPSHLQPLAKKLDQTNPATANGKLEKTELTKALKNVSKFSATEKSQLQELKTLLDTKPAAPSTGTGETGGVTKKIGPGGAWESTVFPPKDGQQREVITFGGGGLKLDGRKPQEIKHQLAGDGVIAVKVGTDATMRGYASATVGGKTPGEAGGPPFHGPVTLNASSPTTIKTLEITHKVPTKTESTDFFPINRTVRAGETVDIDLSKHRSGVGLDQIECIWTASYSVPDPSGRKSDEGKPFYQDGVYADLFLVGKDGVERKIDRTKFVDANEVDNAHDLRGPKGDTLRIKFYARNPEGKDHPITFQGVRFRYETEAGATRPAEFQVNKVFNPGEKAEVTLPPELRNKTIGRVEVRWTDMLSGTWEKPGYAYGTLLVDGKKMGSPESVQSPETQTFSYLNGAKATDGKVGVLIERDKARVDWIKLYFED